MSVDDMFGRKPAAVASDVHRYGFRGTDLQVTLDEVNPVIKTLRENSIEVTALHSHMRDEQPRLFFMHFRANDDAVKLPKGIRGAPDKMAKK